MSKIKIIILATVVLIFSACGNKTPFKEQEPLKNAALVYLYVAESSNADESMEDSKYKTKINGKNVAGTMIAGEYKVFDMKPATVLFTAVRRNIENEHVKLKLRAGHTYFLKTQSAGFGEAFSFKQVNAKDGKRDLKKSSLAGSFELDTTKYIADFAGSTAGVKEGKSSVSAMTEAEIDAIIERKLSQRTSSVKQTVTKSNSLRTTGSKLDEIKEAYEMKKSGALTDEEFKTMKAEILAK
ncbi:SHOCT domain-containing protein [Sulfurimonas sp.]